MAMAGDYRRSYPRYIVYPTVFWLIANDHAVITVIYNDASWVMELKLDNEF